MPTEKKLINLTVPEDVYEKLQKFKEANAIPNDFAACIELMIRLLKGMMADHEY